MTTPDATETVPRVDVMTARATPCLIGASTLLGKRGHSPLKDTPYESGMAPVGSARERFSVKFYLVGMIFILFDIEAAFLYPWAVIYREISQGPWGMFLFGEMLVFIALLAVGYVYVWKKKAFDWNAPHG